MGVRGDRAFGNLEPIREAEDNVMGDVVRNYFYAAPREAAKLDLTHIDIAVAEKQIEAFGKLP